MGTHTNSKFAWLTAVIGCFLLLFPAIEAFLSNNSFATLIATAAILTICVLLGGVKLLLNRGFFRFYTVGRTELIPALFLAIITGCWAIIIVYTPHASYFLFILLLLIFWLLPSKTSYFAALTVTLLTAAGQIVHHGLTTGAVLGPSLTLLVLCGFNLALRALAIENQAKLKALAQLAAAENEAAVLAARSAIARDLHDTVAQSLSSIQMFLGLAATNPTAATENIELARQAAARSLAETRGFISSLTPPADLVNAHLSAALKRVVDRAAVNDIAASKIHKRDATVFELRLAAADAQVLNKLPLPLATVILRTVQASLENVSQHSAATLCTVQITVTSDTVQVFIDDDGVGFDYEATLEREPNSTGGYGLRILQERLTAVGGSAAVITEPGQGTLVALTLPLPNGA